MITAYRIKEAVLQEGDLSNDNGMQNSGSELEAFFFFVVCGTFTTQFLSLALGRACSSL
jgi:hypothetical protein